MFFDEVQECKEIVTAIKFLVDEGSYRYVMSGSLLGVALKDIRSIPVGSNHLRQCYEERHPVDEFIHERMIEMIRLYLIVGGMPAAVQKYLRTTTAIVYWPTSCRTMTMTSHRLLSFATTMCR